MYALAPHGNALHRSVLRQKPGFPTSASLPKGTKTIERSSVMGIVVGSHTYFLAAPSHEEVRPNMGQLALRCRLPQHDCVCTHPADSCQGVTICLPAACRPRCG